MNTVYLRSITEALHDENSKLYQNIQLYRIAVLEPYLIEQDQYKRHNNLDTHMIFDSFTDDQLEEKIIKIFDKIDIKVSTNDIEDCHCMNRSKKTGQQFWKNVNLE